MSPPPPWRWCLPLLLLLLLLHAAPLLAQPQCAARCGGLTIPFPFHLNSTPPSCPLISDSFFSLFCLNSSSLYLTIASRAYRLLRFFPDGVLLDFPSCRRYNDLRSFPLAAGDSFAVSADNVLDLYDCEDSSLCKPGCEKAAPVPGCGGGDAAGYPSCCYPLSDRSAWRAGDGLAGFLRFGCRGFSSWVVSPESGIGLRGVKLEWAVPRNSTQAACDENADVVNATSVGGGIRCRCRDGFAGDGFSVGDGCLKSCFKNGKEVHGNECYQKKHGRKKTIILAGVLTSVLCIISLTALFLLKRTITSDSFMSDQSEISHKAHRPRLFAYHELHDATMGFAEDQRLATEPTSTSSLYAGILPSGSHVAVHKLQCHNQSDLIQMLFKLERLSAISHRNIARIIGWCADASSSAPLIVYELPENGTLRDRNASLDWHTRLNVAAQTACVLAFFHNEFSPPIHHRRLHSGFIFLDSEFSVKLAGFDLNNGNDDNNSNDNQVRSRNDVYSMGLVLVEIIAGSPASSGTLQKIKKGKVEEVVDPSLYYHEQAAFAREQIEIIADLAMRCLLFGGDGKMGMVDVARELVQLAKESGDGCSRRGAAGLEETFSNSSLLQMISMSPDSIHVP